jgi:hypothetical protein
MSCALNVAAKRSGSDFAPLSWATAGIASAPAAVDAAAMKCLRFIFSSAFLKQQGVLILVDQRENKNLILSAFHNIITEAIAVRRFVAHLVSVAQN